ncbi:hypothetical protein PVAP13_4KG099600 [Panicum virgatum]|uniref:Uncharacterized protein n=1 Tax=Panicum virgatum TaxID=38727 RepID=A0A8T0TM50_PANVG|nr:hypothetical protein PVAP13_4KG099600 [Panicum virgatum]
MAAELPEVGMVALCIAVGCAEVLRLLLDFLKGVPVSGPVLDAAAAAAVLTIPMAYIAGIVFLSSSTSMPPQRSRPRRRSFEVLVCSFLLFVAFVFFLAGFGFAAGGRKARRSHTSLLGREGLVGA